MIGSFYIAARLDAAGSSLLSTCVNFAFTESNTVWVPLVVLILEWGFLDVSEEMPNLSHIWSSRCWRWPGHGAIPNTSQATC